MTEYEHVHCLFCQTGKEEVVARNIRDMGYGEAIFPRRLRTLVKNHQQLESWTPLLPGYVFVYTDGQPIPYQRLIALDHVFRVLTYGGAKNHTLAGKDLAFAGWIWRSGGRIGRMKALQVGDRIEIIDGFFKQLQGTITRMDRRRQTLQVTLDTESSIRQLWLSYEIVARVDSEDETPFGKDLQR